MVGVAHFSASINGTLVSKLFHGSEELYESIEFEGMHIVADSIYEIAKAPALVLGTDLAKQVTLLILGQEPKALLSILLVFFPRVISVRFPQPRNASEPIVFKLFGKITVCKDVHPLKAYDEIFAKPSSNSRDDRLLQPENA